MAKKLATSVTVRLTGSPDDEGHVRLHDFSQLLFSLRRCLRHTERCLTEQESSIEYKLVRLEESSALAEVSPITSVQNFSLTLETVRLFRDTVSMLNQNKKIDDRIDSDALEAFRSLYIPLNRNANSLQVNGAEITSLFVASIDDLLRESMTSYGSISGILDTVELHNASKFIVYPVVGPEKVDCQFSREILLDDIRLGLDRNVTVFGLLYYRKKEKFPHRIDAKEIKIHPHDSELPSLLDMKGCMADSDDKRDSVEIIRSLRDEW